MSNPVELYDHAYAHYDADVYQQIRLETYGQDLGQTGWTTTQESNEIPRALQLGQESHALETGCGSGRYALQVAVTTGCRILGIDLNAAGIQNANQLTVLQNLSNRAQFQMVDASEPLPFADSAFDAVFSNDVLCHIRGRQNVFQELFRILKPGARFLFSDALVIGGVISHQELATRSSIGYYLFSPPGENDRLLQKAGFDLLTVTDTTENATQIAKRWHDAREKRRGALLSIESQNNFEGLQKFLSNVQTLTSERRLLRLLYLAQKPA
jgi:SAM-dependent methyltransferase